MESFYDHFTCSAPGMNICSTSLRPPPLQLAQMVVDAGAIAHLTQLVSSPDARLKVGNALYSSCTDDASMHSKHECVILSNKR